MSPISSKSSRTNMPYPRTFDTPLFLLLFLSRLHMLRTVQISSASSSLSADTFMTSGSNLSFSKPRIRASYKKPLIMYSLSKILSPTILLRPPPRQFIVMVDIFTGCVYILYSSIKKLFWLELLIILNSIKWRRIYILGI